MTEELKDKIAKNAASIWCCCYKCDGSINGAKATCNIDTLATCHQWYNAYRGAKLAFDDDRLVSTDTLKTIKQLADAMYHAAQNLTTDASRLHKAMEDYHQFIIQNDI